MLEKIGGGKIIYFVWHLGLFAFFYPYVGEKKNKRRSVSTWEKWKSLNRNFLMSSLYLLTH